MYDILWVLNSTKGITLNTTILSIASLGMGLFAVLAAMIVMVNGQGEQKRRYAFDLVMVGCMFFLTGIVVLLSPETLMTTIFFVLPIGMLAAYIAGTTRNNL